MEQNEKMITIGDFVKILRRRRRGIIVSVLAVILLTVVVILVWTPVYRSTSTILIEEQEIPPEYVMSTVSSFAEQRLQSINQRIMSSERLREIINRFNLYADKRDKYTMEEIIEDMRKKDIKFETVTADVVDRRTGKPTAATIAFTVSYEGENPVVVQQVANVLASLYLEENMKIVGRQATGASKFLEDEMQTVHNSLVELEKKIAGYKEKNPHALPELLQYNLQTLDYTDRSVEQLNDQLRTLKEKEGYLQSQLATMVPDSETQDKDLLKELRAKIVMLKSKYSDEYPDVKKAKMEIEELEKRLKNGDNKGAVPKKPDNPAYVTLDAQLAGTQADINSVKLQIKEAEKKRNDYRQRLEMSPRVEEGYKNLMAERNNTQLKYDDLMKKFMEARVAHGLEKDQLGERFTLIDPARLPEKPVRPKKPVVLLIGIVLALGAGVGTASLQEATDHSAYKSEDLTAAFPVPVLSEIPEIVTLEDELKRRNRSRLYAGMTALSLVVIILLFHFFIMDLYVLWARAARRLG